MPLIHEKGRVLIVIPAFNEQDCLPGTLSELRRVLPQADVVVVDDGSRDDTAALAERQGVPVLRLPFNIGVGGAMRAGFLYAHRRGFRVVVQLDADGQHEPAAVPKLLEALDRDPDVEVVIGTRFGDTSAYRVRGPRRWAMRLLAAVVARRTRTHLTDVTSGFRVAGPRAVELFAQAYPADYLGDTVESLLLAHGHGLKIVQVPVVMRLRQGGRPSTQPVRSMLYLLRALLVLIVFLARRRRPGGRRPAASGMPPV